MKRLLVLTILSYLCLSSAGAQTTDEWLRQNKTQKRYLVQQLAALKLYLKYVKEGYDVAKKGLGLVGDIKDGNFNDHATYFASLSNVNPAVKESGKIILSAKLQESIAYDFDKLLNLCHNNSNVSARELAYITRVQSNLRGECEQSVRKLDSIVRDGYGSMSDDERMKRIDDIYRDMVDKHNFTRSFTGSTRLMLVQRAKEKSAIETLIKLNSER